MVTNLNKLFNFSNELRWVLPSSPIPAPCWHKVKHLGLLLKLNYKGDATLCILSVRLDFICSKPHRRVRLNSCGYFWAHFPPEVERQGRITFSSGTRGMRTHTCLIPKERGHLPGTYLEDSQEPWGSLFPISTSAQSWRAEVPSEGPRGLLNPHKYSDWAKQYF